MELSPLYVVEYTAAPEPRLHQIHGSGIDFCGQSDFCGPCEGTGSCEISANVFDTVADV